MTLDILASAYHLSRNTVDAERWTAEEWVKLARAYQACGWDLTPDRWAPWQVAAVLADGTVPRWSPHTELPVLGWRVDKAGRIHLTDPSMHTSVEYAAIHMLNVLAKDPDLIWYPSSTVERLRRSIDGSDLTPEEIQDARNYLQILAGRCDVLWCDECGANPCRPCMIDPVCWECSERNIMHHRGRFLLTIP